MKSREERYHDLNKKMFQVYAEYLEECANDASSLIGMEDVFNTALQALAQQTTSITNIP